MPVTDATSALATAAAKRDRLAGRLAEVTAAMIDAESHAAAVIARGDDDTAALQAVAQARARRDATAAALAAAEQDAADAERAVTVAHAAARQQTANEYFDAAQSAAEGLERAVDAMADLFILTEGAYTNARRANPAPNGLAPELHLGWFVRRALARRGVILPDRELALTDFAGVSASVADRIAA